jgi:hypothetical protein
LALSNPKAFFDAVRTQLFAGNLTMGQTAGINTILTAWTAEPDARFVAYALATAYWETGQKMLPVREDGLGRGRPYGKPAGPWKQIYYGRGLVQLTWYANYGKADASLRALGLIDATDDLTKTPDLVLRPDLAADIMTLGMIDGWFTGAKLADFFNANKSDPVNARRIINGTDHANDIAGYHARFCAALKAGGYS